MGACRHELYGCSGNRLALRVENRAPQARIVALTQTIEPNKQAASNEQHHSGYASESHRVVPPTMRMRTPKAFTTSSPGLRVAGALSWVISARPSQPFRGCRQLFARTWLIRELFQSSLS